MEHINYNTAIESILIELKRINDTAKHMVREKDCTSSDYLGLQQRLINLAGSFTALVLPEDEGEDEEKIES